MIYRFSGRHETSTQTRYQLNIEFFQCSFGEIFLQTNMSTINFLKNSINVVHNLGNNFPKDKYYILSKLVGEVSKLNLSV